MGAGASMRSAMKIVRCATPKNWREIEAHPLANLIGFGIGIDLDQMTADMQNNGYDESEPIVLYEKMVLDGRHRQASAVGAEIDSPPFAEFRGTYEEAVRYVSKKMLRQHFDDSQRAMFAAALATLPRGRPAENATKEGELNPQICGFTTEQAAKVADVSPRSVESAKVVIEKGTPKLQEAVKDRTISVSDAAKVAEQPKATQNKAVDAVKSGQAKTASAAASALAKLCDRCKRIGKASCEKCRADAKKEIRTPSRNGVPQPKTGKELFSWATFYDQFRPIAQAPDKIAAAYKREVDSPDFEKAQRLLNEFITLMKGWQKRLGGTR